MFASRRHFLAGLTATGLVPSVGAAADSDTITPEAFGAKGDGRTNDTDAFAAMSADVNARGGGTIALRPVTYIVGKQARPRSAELAYAYAPSDIIHLVGCTGPVIIRGNGAVLRAEPGLRYGAFDPGSGAPITHGSSNRRLRASPYMGMIYVESCTNLVDISDVELDGGVQGMQIGGRAAKGGWQGFGGTGVRLMHNSGPERLSRIHSHHHPQDGLIITGVPGRNASSLILDVTCEFNVRQGCSLTGGRNHRFERCRFRRTGKAGLRSAPGAGVDIEGEGGRTIRNVTFFDCEFSDNAGPGLIADTGDSEGVTCTRCTFVGTTTWAAWPNKPRMRFDNCLFVGSVVHAYGDPDPARATQFMDCTFSDDPALSPTGTVFGSSDRPRPIAILRKSTNVRFSRCRFLLTANAQLPFSIPEVIYSDCDMAQRSPTRSRPRGTYVGTNRLTGNIDLKGSIIIGTVVLNGQTVPRKQ